MIKKVKEIYNYREMVSGLIHRDLRGKYKASVLGFLWTFLNPLFQLAVYTLLFSVIMRSGIEQFYIFLFVGLVPWTFFSSCVSWGAACVINQENLIKKIYFPRIILPIAYVSSAFVNMLLTFLVIFAVLFISGFGINLLALCFLPVIMIVEYVLALGICMLTSALTVYFRDLEYILGIVAMAWMYLTPILYTTDMIPKQFRGLFGLNPMAPVIMAYQQVLYYKQVPDISTLVQAVLIGFVALLAGSISFETLQKKFVEEL